MIRESPSPSTCLVAGPRTEISITAAITAILEPGAARLQSPGIPWLTAIAGVEAAPQGREGGRNRVGGMPHSSGSRTVLSRRRIVSNWGHPASLGVTTKCLGRALPWWTVFWSRSGFRSRFEGGHPHE